MLSAESDITVNFRMAGEADLNSRRNEAITRANPPAQRRARAALAQLVEHIIRNDGVRCSSHLSGTKISRVCQVRPIVAETQVDNQDTTVGGSQPS